MNEITIPHTSKSILDFALVTNGLLTTAQKSPATIASEKNFILNYVSLCQSKAEQKLSNVCMIWCTLYILIDFMNNCCMIQHDVLTQSYKNNNSYSIVFFTKHLIPWCIYIWLFPIRISLNHHLWLRYLHRDFWKCMDLVLRTKNWYFYLICCCLKSVA